MIRNEQYIFPGSISEFEETMNSNRNQVYATAYSRLSSHPDAEDIMQETFIYAYFNFRCLRDKDKLSAWLCSIARNKALKLYSVKKKVIPIENLYEFVTTNDPEKLIINKAGEQAVYDAISVLSDTLRETVVLYYISERSIEEISRILSVPVGTIKRRLFDARKVLKEKLSDSHKR